LNKSPKILVISLAGIGDTLLATPLLRTLRQQRRRATIDVLARWPGARDLLAGNAHVDRVFQRDLVKESIPANIKFLGSIRRERYDVSINVHPQGKIEYRVIARLIGARLRVSHRYENYSRIDRLFINRSIDQDYSVHCVENNFRLLPLIGMEETKEPIDIELVLSSEDQEWARQFVISRALESRLRIGIHVGSGTTKNLILKRWPVENFITVIKTLLAECPQATVLLFGGPEELKDNQHILAEIKDTRLLPVPSRSLKQAAALLPHCDLFMSVDNVFMHLAAAMKVPEQIVIESPTFNKTIEPYHRPFRLVSNPMVAGRSLDYYRYDGRDVQGGTEHLLACMRSITPEAVLNVAREAIANRKKP